MNKNNDIHLVLTHYEAMALLRAMADAEFGQLSNNDQLDILPQEEATVRQAWDRVKYKIYGKMSNNAGRAT